MSFVLFLLAVAVAWLFFSLRAAREQAHFDRRRIDELEHDVRELYTNWVGRVKRLEDDLRALRARLSGVEPVVPETATEAESAPEPPATEPGSPAAAVSDAGREVSVPVPGSGPRRTVAGATNFFR